MFFFWGCFLGCFCWMFLGCLWKEMLRTGHLRHEFAHGVGNHAWICFKLHGGWLHDAIATIAAMSAYILDQTRHCKIPQFYPYSRMIFPWKEWISMGSMAKLGFPNGRSLSCPGRTTISQPVNQSRPRWRAEPFSLVRKPVVFSWIGNRWIFFTS